ncbi:MAG: hypothetical protein H0U98_14340 [Alphaproteobacteria bacterium]|nr:hypothetical protein [Alphaproteobacteria bacterium]
MNSIKIGILAIAVIGFAIAILADATSPHRGGSVTGVADLISQEESLNEKCRGGSGDDPATQKFCDKRDRVFAQIRAKGWCWESDNGVEADKKWEPCATTSQSEPTSTPTEGRDPYEAGQKALGDSEYERGRADLFSQITDPDQAATWLAGAPLNVRFWI